MESKISNEEIAHGLAVAYVSNRFGPEVSGVLRVETVNGEVTGSGLVTTERLPSADERLRIKVRTGEQRLFGLVKRRIWVDTNDLAVDSVFELMVTEYRQAYERFLFLLNSEDSRSHLVTRMTSSESENFTSPKQTTRSSEDL